MAMARRDRLERGGRRGARAAARARGPEFLYSDDMEEDDADGGLLSGMKRRTRRQYDERRDLDDMEGVEDVCLFFNFAIQMLHFLPGITDGTTGRYQGKVDRRMDCNRTRSTRHREAFPPFFDELCRRTWKLCLWRTYSQSRGE
jgi:Mini-chromosome maintenance protein 2